MATFYAHPSAAQGTGTGISEANAATLKQCIENDGGLHTALVSGSVIHCIAGSVSFDGSAGDFATTAIVGTWQDPIRVLTYTTTAGDGLGIVEITDSNLGATNDALVISLDYWTFRGFKFLTPRSGVSISTGADGINLIDIEVDSAASYGFEENASTGTSTAYISCYAHDCTSDGFYSGARSNRYFDCVSINNTNGFNIRNTAYGCTAVGCIAVGNSGTGFISQTEGHIVNCAFVNNGSSGFVASNAIHQTLINTICGDNTDYGLSGNYANTTMFAINCNIAPANHLNGLGAISTNVDLVEILPRTDDPLWVDPDPADNNDVDLTPGIGSGLVADSLKLGGTGFAGLSYKDLGPIQRRDLGYGAMYAGMHI